MHQEYHLRKVAIEAPEEGQFTTVALKLQSKRIALNYETGRTGSIRVEIRDHKFQIIPNKTFAQSDLLHGDHISLPLTWNGEDDLSPYMGQTIYLRFRMRAAKLFAVSG